MTILVNIILCIMFSLRTGNQIINNEAYVYGSHFGGNLKSVYPILYNSTLPHGIPSKDNDGIRLQHFQSINGSKFLSVSKNRHFGKGKHTSSNDNCV